MDKELDKILDKITAYQWEEDEEPTIDAVELLQAKIDIKALITSEKNKLLNELIEHRLTVIEDKNGDDTQWLEAVPVDSIKRRISDGSN